ncbi:MAG: hypothetical protein MUE60_05125 [Candidatus Eisenbacteria bacterium]|jgi:DNA-directed RNA polymerase omega subunit|nr:hypothetical protein [Candidatus Eisenbacteria bacterium]
MVFPIDDVIRSFGNKYEAIIVSSREARRINSLRLAAGGAPEGAVKPTVEALRRLMSREVKWRYVERDQPSFVETE